MNNSLEPLRIKSVSRGSPAARAGLHPNDHILAVNGCNVEDEFDFSYYCACESSVIVGQRAGRNFETILERRGGEFVGIDFHFQGIRRCTCHCVFCFIDQMPPGLRASLYVKDEDYRYSFLDGNYMTLCSTREKDLHKIIERGISPLYISVHATEPAVRQRMIRNRFAGRILQQLQTLEKGGICFHAQVVVCPGYNDGKHLETTVRNLLAFRQGLVSLAIVPVGLTRFRRQPLDAVTPQIAREICSLIDRVGEADGRRMGRRRVFASDELFLRAGMKLPVASYYEDFPQIGNGVGLIRQLMLEWPAVRKTIMAAAIRRSHKSLRVVLVTALSAAPYLRTLCRRIEKLLPSCSLTVEAVANDYLGTTVTVAGLLCGRDVRKAVMRIGDDATHIVVPAVMFNNRGVTLDGYSLKRIGRGVSAAVFAAATLHEFVEYLLKSGLSRQGVRAARVGSAPKISHCRKGSS